jgi:hypothetical protein
MPPPAVAFPWAARRDLSMTLVLAKYAHVPAVGPIMSE